MTQIAKFFLSFSMVLAGWTGIASLSGTYGKFDALIVPIARDDFPSRVPDSVSIIGQIGSLPIYRGDGETLAKMLRDAGAVMLLPASAGLCLAS
jgi:hypothetical protein